MKKPLVSVTWLDAHGSSTNELEEQELPTEPARYTTHGLLVKESPSGIVVAGEETPQLTYRQWSFIPRVLIVEIKYIGAKPRKKKEPPVV